MGRTDPDTLSLNLPLKTAPIVSLRALEDGDSDFEYLELSPRSSIWKRALSMLRRRRDSGARRASIQGRELLCKFPSHAIEEKEGLQWKRRRWSRWLKGSRACWAFPVLVLVFFSIIHIIIFLMSFVPVFLDDFHNWNRPGLPGSDLSSYSPNFTHGVIPVNCHSHNDYWRRIPLYEALRYGCTGVEADVWLFSNELFVGHNTHSLTRDQTFRSMYVDPLVALLDKQNPGIEFSTNAATTRKNGIFDTKPSQTVVLLVDFKNEGTDIFPVVSSQLSALREKGYLTYYDGKTTVFGPITVVATGNAPFDLITRNTTYRDIFFDAPLDRMYEPAPSSTSSPSKLEPMPVRTSGQGTVGVTSTSVFDATNSFYASVSFKKSIGILWGGRISTSQLELIRGQIRGARARGLKPRYWSTPGWPKSLRNKVWRVLVEEGVEYLNGDDLEALTKGEWRAGRNGN